MCLAIGFPLRVHATSHYRWGAQFAHLQPRLPDEGLLPVVASCGTECHCSRWPARLSAALLYSVPTIAVIDSLVGAVLGLR